MSKLLYKASVDGDDYKIFHKNCDNMGETVTIITVNKINYLEFMQL